MPRKMGVPKEIIQVSWEVDSINWLVVLYYNKPDCKYTTLEITDREVLHYFDNLSSNIPVKMYDI